MSLKTDKYYETYDYNSRRPVFVELETLREDPTKTFNGK